MDAAESTAVENVHNGSPMNISRSKPFSDLTQDVTLGVDAACPCCVASRRPAALNAGARSVPSRNDG